MISRSLKIAKWARKTMKNYNQLNCFLYTKKKKVFLPATTENKYQNIPLFSIAIGGCKFIRLCLQLTRSFINPLLLTSLWYFYSSSRILWPPLLLLHHHFLLLILTFFLLWFFNSIVDEVLERCKLSCFFRCSKKNILLLCPCVHVCVLVISMCVCVCMCVFYYALLLIYLSKNKLQNSSFYFLILFQTSSLFIWTERKPNWRLKHVKRERMRW